MAACKAELCPSWTGQGCICAVLGEVFGEDLWDEAQPLPRVDRGLSTDPRGFGPIFTASFESESACCGESIVPGEDIRADGHGGWIHADDQCEKMVAPIQDSLARAVGKERLTCEKCFLIHGAEGCDR